MGGKQASSAMYENVQKAVSTMMSLWYSPCNVKSTREQVPVVLSGLSSLDPSSPRSQLLEVVLLSPHLEHNHVRPVVRQAVQLRIEMQSVPSHVGVAQVRFHRIELAEPLRVYGICRRSRSSRQGIQLFKPVEGNQLYQDECNVVE